MALPPMPTQTEVAASMYGTWRLFIGDKAGLGFFGSGEAGFWRASWVLAAVVPFNILIFLFQAASVEGASVSIGALIQLILAVAIAWFGYALAVHYVLPAIDREERFLDYMIPEFWSSLPTIVIQFAAIAIDLSEVLPGAFGKVLTIASFGGALWLRAQIIRLALDVSYGVSVGLVVAGLIFHALIAAMLIPNI